MRLGWCLAHSECSKIGSYHSCCDPLCKRALRTCCMSGTGSALGRQRSVPRRTRSGGGSGKENRRAIVQEVLPSGPPGLGSPTQERWAVRSEEEEHLGQMELCGKAERCEITAAEVMSLCQRGLGMGTMKWEWRDRLGPVSKGPFVMKYLKHMFKIERIVQKNPTYPSPSFNNWLILFHLYPHPFSSTNTHRLILKQTQDIISFSAEGFLTSVTMSAIQMLPH